MARRTIELTDALYDYLLDVGVRDDELMQRLREETAALPVGHMQISPEQGQLMALLVKAIGARRALEVGVFTGYSALCVARALPAEGSLVACDISDEWTQIARRYWREAGVDQKIDLRLGPAVETLQEMVDSGRAGTFDFAFIDADKATYDAYYELALELLRGGGLMLLDNVLRGGAVADPQRQDEDILVLRELNRKIHQDSRVDMCMTPVSDGLTLVRKRQL